MCLRWTLAVFALLCQKCPVTNGIYLSTEEVIWEKAVQDCQERGMSIPTANFSTISACAGINHRIWTGTKKYAWRTMTREMKSCNELSITCELGTVEIESVNCIGKNESNVCQPGQLLKYQNRLLSSCNGQKSCNVSHILRLQNCELSVKYSCTRINIKYADHHHECSKYVCNENRIEAFNCMDYLPCVCDVRPLNYTATMVKREDRRHKLLNHTNCKPPNSWQLAVLRRHHDDGVVGFFVMYIKVSTDESKEKHTFLECQQFCLKSNSAVVRAPQDRCRTRGTFFWTDIFRTVILQDHAGDTDAVLFCLTFSVDEGKTFVSCNEINPYICVMGNEPVCLQTSETFAPTTIARTTAEFTTSDMTSSITTHLTTTDISTPSTLTSQVSSTFSDPNISSSGSSVEKRSGESDEALTMTLAGGLGAVALICVILFVVVVWLWRRYRSTGTNADTTVYEQPQKNITPTDIDGIARKSTHMYQYLEPKVSDSFTNKTCVYEAATKRSSEHMYHELTPSVTPVKPGASTFTSQQNTYVDILPDCSEQKLKGPNSYHLYANDVECNRERSDKIGIRKTESSPSTEDHEYHTLEKPSFPVDTTYFVLKKT